MNNFQARLDEFFQGNLSLQELEDAIDQLDPDPIASQHLLESLEQAFASGRLPTQVYHSLKNRVSHTDTGGEEATRLDRSHVVTSEPTIWSREHEEPPDPVDQTIQRIEPDDAPQDLADQTIQAIEQDDAPQDPGETTRQVVGPIQPPSRPVTDSSFDLEHPSQGSRATGSNWGRPDQWSDSNLGPIQPGTIINDRFTIESQLGKGGMGVVFEARDRRKEEAQDSDPYIAIKILNQEFRNHPQALIALQREASKAQTLAHPNIVTVYDFDRDGTTVFMTMELLRGESLSDRIRSFRRGGASRDEAVPIIIEMAAGLAYAHKRDIIHSDFKPANVFVTDDNRVKILDFGIARATKYGGVNRGSETVFDAGDLGALTPAYASLEMLNGEPPHPADDVYALAVTAYQLLSGEHPFKRQTAKEALEARLTPRPIKGLKRREWNAIANGLQFRRDERIQDAAQFLRLFRGAAPITKTAATVIVMLVVAASYFGFLSFQEEGPAIPFEQLPANVQVDFNRAIKEANAYLALGDGFEGDAFPLFDDAWNIHPRNDEARRGLDIVALALIEKASDARADPRKRRRVLREIEIFSKNQYLAEHKELRDARKQLSE